MNSLRLGINIDHVATLRNARGGEHPCPVRAAIAAMEAGTDGITAHLREDRRHIKDRDMERLKAEVNLPLNFEMAATEEMVAIALRIKPHGVCLVPERREELTTEGGLDVALHYKKLLPVVGKLQDVGIIVSLFIDPSHAQIDAAHKTGAKAVELHTGAYAECWAKKDTAPEPCKEQLAFLYLSAQRAHAAGFAVHAGHGLNYDNVGPIASLPEVEELNIGHFLMGEAMFVGMKAAVKEMRQRMDEART